MTMRPQSWTESDHTSHIEELEQNKIPESEPSKLQTKELSKFDSQHTIGTERIYPQHDRKLPQ